MTDKRVSICCFLDKLEDYESPPAFVAIDVIRATTTAITAVSMGRQCYVTPNLESAFEIASLVPDALLVGEIGGEMPDGFDLTNSPAQVAAHTDTSRPMVLLSSSGSRLMHEIGNTDWAYASCFRNFSATINHLAENHDAVVIMGAGTLGEFREEDQMCCAWIAEGLQELGFVPTDAITDQLIERWRDAPKDAFVVSRSVDYLRRSGQLCDLEFILNHFDDVHEACKLSANEATSPAVVTEV